MALACSLNHNKEGNGDDNVKDRTMPFPHKT